MRADVLDPAEADAVVGLDEDHRPVSYWSGLKSTAKSAILSLLTGVVGTWLSTTSDAALNRAAFPHGSEFSYSIDRLHSRHLRPYPTLVLGAL